MPRALLLMVKFPEPGKVKTRLAASVGEEAAATIYRQLVSEVWKALPYNAQLVVCFDPPERELEVRAWLGELLPQRITRVWAQDRGDLGQRMEAAFAKAFRFGFSKVAVIGSDCVALDPALFDQVWQALESSEGVIGPTHDGGYYLLGLRQPTSALFAGIAWSTDSVLAQTLENAKSLGWALHHLPTLSDVDTLEDWERAKLALKVPILEREAHAQS